MDRYGAPRFRGSSNAGYGRQGPGNRSGLLGAVPSRPAPGQQAHRPQSILKHSRGGEWQGGRDGILGAPPPKPGSRDAYGGGRGGGGSWDERRIKPSEGGRKSDEVSQLMKSLGLSQADIQKLSQMPDHEINVNNLAKAIGDLKKGGQPQFSGANAKTRSSSMYDPSHPTDDEYDSHNQRGRYQNETRSQYQRGGGGGNGSGGILGEAPYSRSGEGSYNKERPGSNYKPVGAGRGPPLMRKPGLRDDDSYDRREQRGVDRGHNDDDFYSRDDRDRSHGRNNSDQYSQSRNESFRTKRIVEEINDDRQGPGYGRSQRVEPNRKPLPQRPAPRGLLQPPDSRSGGSHQDGHSVKRPRWDRDEEPFGGLLGNPLQPNARGLENLAAAVVRSPSSSLSIAQAASVLNPLLMQAQQADPAVLEVQLQAIKVLQAEALKQQTTSLLEKTAPKPLHPNSRPMSKQEKFDRRDEDARRNAKKEADEMRAMGCRVLYMRFKSSRIQEADLRQLAAAFGRVTNVLIIRAKVPNGFNQAFMEMQQSDCAAAMVEHYKAKQPVVLGCSVLVDRSNYRDLTLRESEQRKRARSRSMSPIREGTTQLTHKRTREFNKNDPPRLNVSVSDNRRMVTRTNTKSPPPKDARNDIRRRSMRSRSSERKREDSKTRGSPTDGKRRLPADRRRPSDTKRRSGSKEKRNSKDRTIPKEAKRPNEDEERSGSQEKETEKVAGERTEEDKKDETENATADNKVESSAESEKAPESVKDGVVEADPLDEIADELALHDDFGLVDVEFDTNAAPGKKDRVSAAESEDDSKPKAQQLKGSELGEAKKELKGDLDRKDLDLDDINVDMSQDEEAEKTAHIKAEPQDAEESEIKEDQEDKDEIPEESTAEQAAEEMSSIKQEEESSSEQAEDLNEEDTPVVKEEDTSVSMEIEEAAEEPKAEQATEEEDAEERNDKVVEEANRSLSESEALPGSQQSDSHSQATDQEDVTPDNEVEEEEEDTQESTQDPLEQDADQNDEVTRLKYIVTSALQEVANAQEHLVALNKTTKNRATVAVSKKLKLCLDGAVARLESAETTET